MGGLFDYTGLTGNMVEHTDKSTHEAKTINQHEKFSQLLIIWLTSKLSANCLKNQPTKKNKICDEYKGHRVRQITTFSIFGQI